MMALGLLVLAAVGGGAYLDVRKLPRGGGITIEDPATGETIEQSWSYTTRERLHMWLFGRLPGPSAED